MALEDVSQSYSDVSYVNITQLTDKIPLSTPDEASGNVPQKMSEFELFAPPKFSTMAIDATAESVVEVKTGTPSSSESPCSSTTDVNMDKYLLKESEFYKVEQEFSTLALEDVS